uniref:Uncharacterized protein n=1 Tax=Parascaris equorum TaxID=6256 RepID=A0A914RMD9_PAREQ
MDVIIINFQLMRPFIVFVLIFLVVFERQQLGARNTKVVSSLIGTRLLLPWCGFTIGCFTAVLLRQPPPNVTAIFSFPDPDADISALIPVIAASLTPVPLLSAVVAWLHGVKYPDLTSILICAVYSEISGIILIQHPYC